MVYAHDSVAFAFTEAADIVPLFLPLRTLSDGSAALSLVGLDMERTPAVLITVGFALCPLYTFWLVNNAARTEV